MAKQHRYIGEYTNKTITITANEAYVELTILQLESSSANATVAFETGKFGAENTTTSTMSNNDEILVPSNGRDVIDNVVITIPSNCNIRLIGVKIN